MESIEEYKRYEWIINSLTYLVVIITLINFSFFKSKKEVTKSKNKNLNILMSKYLSLLITSLSLIYSGICLFKIIKRNDTILNIIYIINVSYHFYFMPVMYISKSIIEQHNQLKKKKDRKRIRINNMVKKDAIEMDNSIYVYPGIMSVILLCAGIIGNIENVTKYIIIPNTMVVAFAINLIHYLFYIPYLLYLCHGYKDKTYSLYGVIHLGILIGMMAILCDVGRFEYDSQWSTGNVFDCIFYVFLPHMNYYLFREKNKNVKTNTKKHKKRKKGRQNNRIGDVDNKIDEVDNKVDDVDDIIEDVDVGIDDDNELKEELEFEKRNRLAREEEERKREEEREREEFLNKKSNVKKKKKYKQLKKIKL